ncbi:hypothetical protein [Microcoleus sp. AT3-D2]|uniref:hypothetical protein n=1 Tax=Microcoleus sp. AT3-D2 TaxID=2818612 RepID=UPI002FD3C437
MICKTLREKDACTTRILISINFATDLGLLYSGGAGRICRARRSTPSVFGDSQNCLQIVSKLSPTSYPKPDIYLQNIPCNHREPALETPKPLIPQGF